MDAYDLPATSSLVSDNGKPDFIVGNTTQNTDLPTLFLGIIIGIVLGILICFLYKWADKKYKQYLKDDNHNDESNETNDKE